jgi:ParB family chromosome partitioning protein
LLEVAPGQIRPNPRQPRQRFEETALQELAASIVEHGLLQPLIVTPLPASEAGIPEFQLIAGERRWQAAKLAHLPRVPVIVKEATPRQSLEMALIENIQRADLNPLEEAAAYQQLHQDHGLTHEEIARRVGKSRVTITNSLRLLSLPREARRLLLEGEISEGHARVLLSLPSEAARLELLRLVLARHLSVDGLALVGLYGMERSIDGAYSVDPRVEPYRVAVAAATAELEARLPAEVVEPKAGISVTLHWRPAPEQADTTPYI